MLDLFPVLAIIIVLITVWAVLRKGLAGMPLIIGMWLLFADALLLVYWFPPTPPQIATVFFLGGVAIMLIVWGLYNVWLNLAMVKKLRKLNGAKMLLPKPITVDGKEITLGLTIRTLDKPSYGVMYGLISWDDQGADLLFRFLNEKVWGSGLKLEQFQAEHAQIGGSHCAFIMGILRPKTIIDRILY